MVDIISRYFVNSVLPGLVTADLPSNQQRPGRHAAVMHNHVEEDTGIAKLRGRGAEAELDRAGHVLLDVIWRRSVSHRL